MKYISVIEDEFEKIKADRPFFAAQYAFVIAMIAKKQGDNDKAVAYARECVALIPESVTEMDIATSFVELNGVLLPSLLTKEIVRQKLLPIEF